MARLKLEDLTVIVDSREQDGYTLAPMGLRVEGLASGDYSVDGLTDLIALERKTLPDLVSCVGPEKPRFMREMQRLRAYPFRAVVIEADWATLEAGDYRSRTSALAVVNSVISWQVRYALPFALVGSREAGERDTREFLYRAALRVWERSQLFQQTLEAKRGAA